MCARNKKFISQRSTFSWHDSKKEPGLVLDVVERVHLQLEEFIVIGLAQPDLQKSCGHLCFQ